MKNVLINIVGTPRNLIEKNCESIIDNLVKPNENFNFDVVIHTSFNYKNTKWRIEMDKKRKPNYSSKEELYNYFFKTYSKLTSNINIIIEDIDFNIGKNNPSKIIFYIIQIYFTDEFYIISTRYNNIIFFYIFNIIFNSSLSQKP